MFDNMRKSEFIPLPPTVGRIIVCVPSLRHVKALQVVLGDRISQEEPIVWEEFHANPDDYQNKARLIFLQAETTGETIAKMPSQTTFLAEDVFVFVDGKKILPLRDQTSRKWGDENTTSEDALARYFDVLATIPEEPYAS